MRELIIKIEPQVPDYGICFNTAAPELPVGEVITVKVNGCRIYRVIEALAAGFTAVVYGLIGRVLAKIRCKISKFAVDRQVMPVRSRMAKLSFAGGLRL